MERGLRVLLIEDDAAVRQAVGEFLRVKGYDLREAGDGAEGLALFAQQPAEMVITDVCMPGMDGLEVLSRIKKSAPETCVVVMTGYGTEETAIRAMRCGASNYFKKPVNFSEFSYALGVLADLARSRRGPRLDGRLLERQILSLRLDNDLDAIYPVIRALVAMTEGLPFDVESVRVGLLEMLTNAIEHGNLGIGRDEKLAALRNGTLRELYARRAAAAPGRDRTVRVEYDVTPERLSCRIVDQGEGFRWRDVHGQDDPEKLFAESGRGITVARLVMDEVVYNERGNEVLIVKRARPADRAPVPPCQDADREAGAVTGAGCASSSAGARS